MASKTRIGFGRNRISRLYTERPSPRRAVSHSEESFVYIRAKTDAVVNCGDSFATGTARFP